MPTNYYLLDEIYEGGGKPLIKFDGFFSRYWKKEKVWEIDDKLWLEVFKKGRATPITEEEAMDIVGDAKMVRCTDCLYQHNITHPQDRKAPTVCYASGGNEIRDIQSERICAGFTPRKYETPTSKTIEPLSDEDRYEMFD